MKILVATCAHRGDDARIVHRQIRSMIDAGHMVVLISPSVDETSRAHDPPGLVRVAVERASGRRRMKSWQQVRRAIRDDLTDTDVLLIHDIELVPVVGLMCLGKRRAIWDVHEAFDEVALSREWLPVGARRVVRWFVRLVQAFGRFRFTIVVAEKSYRRRFPGAAVVPNSTWVTDRPLPMDERHRVVYVGRISQDRGLDALVAIGRRLRRVGGPSLVVIGQPDESVRGALEQSCREGDVQWLGSLANVRALDEMAGAVAGLSLLGDTPNYRGSMPTKILEYAACAVPVITTPLPLASSLVERSGCGFVTTCFEGDDLVEEVVEFVLRLERSAELRNDLGERAWRYVRSEHNWFEDSRGFLQILESGTRPHRVLAD